MNAFSYMFRNCARLIPLIAIPLYSHKKYQNAFFSRGPSRNSIQQRCFIDVEVSNHPCQDRSDRIQLTAIDGYAAAVYDGHGGWQVSDYCSKHLLKTLDSTLHQLKSKIEDKDQLIKAAIKEAFRKVQSDFMAVAQIGYKMGFGRFARAGSCALVCVVSNNKIYSGNTGDSLGLLIKQSQRGQMNYIQLNKEQNANHQYERQKLKEKFPNESDIVICKKENNRSCYVKGRLQPTRSIGDLRLKHKQFNNPQNYPPENDYQPPLKVFTGPYINSQPEIMSFDIQKNHRCVILASDGLWDELERQQVSEIVKSKTGKQIPSILIYQTLKKAAQAIGSNVEKLRQIPRGKKRKIHDDITVVVLDLQNQYK